MNGNAVMTSKSPPAFSRYVIPILAMCAIVAASNYLVQIPFGFWNLQDLLTWGAFTYPIAFLVTDLTNRRFGATAARKIVFAGFVLAVILSIWLATPRIAIASGFAFLIAQLIDVGIFDRLRRAVWWQAPLISSTLGAIVDTILFFSLAFAATFNGLDELFATKSDGFVSGLVPFFGSSMEAPRWLMWAFGDFGVKILVALAMLLPYGILRSFISSAEHAEEASAS